MLRLVAVLWGYSGGPRAGWRSRAHAAAGLTPTLAAAVLRRADQVETVLSSNGRRAGTGWACCCRHKAGGGGAPGKQPPLPSPGTVQCLRWGLAAV